MTDPFTSSFHGSATISEKGQVVIPASARKAMGLETGEKLLVFGVGGGMLMLCKVSEMEKFAGHLMARLKVVESAMETVGDRLDKRELNRTGPNKPKGRRHERRADRDD
jgi:AbrB family looped-hinge helix DNA binding protein